MSKRVLVTGATGLIGRRVVTQLVSIGWQVTGLDRSIDSRLSTIPESVRREVRWIEGDSRDREKFETAAKGVDAIAHLAAGASFLMYEEAPTEHTAGTICGFHNALETAVRHGIGRIVYASTSAVYEGNPVPYHESMALRPPDLKAFSKKVNEEMADIYADRYQIRPVGLRPFSVYGEDEMSKGKYANIISLFTWAMLGGQRPIVWGDGSQTRDFIHVSDAARAFVLAIESDSDARCLNVGTGTETSFGRVVELLGEKLGIDPMPIHVATPISIYAQRLLADMSTTERVLGFVPQVTVEAGLDLVLEHGRRTLDTERWRHLPYAQTIVLKEKGIGAREIELAGQGWPQTEAADYGVQR
jgi:nucleoside-diphosphate-sugar epimerase